jgi:hypothetical protein
MKISTQGTAGPRIQPLPRPVRQIWLVLHVVSSVGWIGVEIAMLTLCFTGLATEDPQRVHAMYSAASLLANVFFLPGTLLVLVTGIVISLGTKWGLARYYWVLAKLVIALVVTAVATISQPAPPGVVGAFLVACGLFAIAAVLSIVKPWGRVNWRRIARTQP